MLNLNCVGALVHFDVLMFEVIYDVKPYLSGRKSALDSSGTRCEQFLCPICNLNAP